MKETFLIQHFHDQARSIEYYQKQMFGYRILQKASHQSREALLNEVKCSSLRGRGGAGFLTWKKWSFLPQDSKKQRYLICNADESEPGTFKDRKILKYTPHLLIEGMLIAAYTLNIRMGYIYIRGEYAEEAQIVQNAIDEAYALKWLGAPLFQKDFQFDLTLHRGAGAYICGEETALLNSIEGKRGEPRVKPPFPAHSGLFECPTIVNNVETLSVLPWIIERGGKWFSEYGKIENGERIRLFCVSGDVKKPGVFEFPAGSLTLRELIEKECGGIIENRSLKAVIPGGTSTIVLAPHEIDVPLDVDSLRKIGSGLGSAGIIVMSDRNCILRLLIRVVRFYANESCGQCTPCREGCRWMERLLVNIEKGHGKIEDLELLKDIANNVHDQTLCPFGEAVANPVLSFIQKFYTDFEAHIRGGKCQYAP